MACKLLILSCLPLLAASLGLKEETLTSKTSVTPAVPEKSPQASAQAVHDEHHEARKELKKLLDGKSPEEIAALRQKVDAIANSGPGPGLLVKASGEGAPAASSTNLAVAQNAPNPAPDASPTCPDGFVPATAGGCCVSQSVHQLKSATLLCDNGWKLKQTGGESFTCCPPGAAAAAPHHEKAKETAVLKQQIQLIKTQFANNKGVQSSGVANKDTHKGGQLPADGPLPKVQGASPQHVKMVDLHRKKEELKSKTRSKEELKKMLDNMLTDFKHGGEEIDLDEHEYKVEHPAEYKAMHSGIKKEPWYKQVVEPPLEDPSWTFTSYCKLMFLLAVIGFWWRGQFTIGNHDMRFVPVPGFADVNAERSKLLNQSGGSSKLDSEEYGDLLDAGYGAGSTTSAATMKPMTNPATSWGANSRMSAVNDDDDIGL